MKQARSYEANNPVKSYNAVLSCCELSMVLAWATYKTDSTLYFANQTTSLGFLYSQGLFLCWSLLIISEVFLALLGGTKRKGGFLLLLFLGLGLLLLLFSLSVKAFKRSCALGSECGGGSSSWNESSSRRWWKAGVTWQYSLLYFLCPPNLPILILRGSGFCC